MALPKNFGGSPQKGTVKRIQSPPQQQQTTSTQGNVEGDPRPPKERPTPKRSRPVAVVRDEKPPRNPPPKTRPATDLQDVEEGFSIDPKTGEKFKNLPGVIDPSVLRGSPKAIFERTKNIGMSDFRRLVEEDEDFAKADTFHGGLNKLAETFLPHLRVPPSEEEIRKLREEKIKIQRDQDALFESQKEEWDKNQKKEMGGDE